MSTVRNILFIMCDQLRWDYLSCYGHPTLRTPNVDWLASRGVRFDRAYVQSPVCGPSRASFYTGRTVFSHGATWNHVPLPISEMAIGDYLRPHGIRTAVVGKTHQFGDPEAMARLGLTRETEIGVLVAEPGFDPYERDDGLHPHPIVKKRPNKLRYNDWLNTHGYPGDNPWDDFANSAKGPNGEVLSAWNLRYSNLPARVKEEHSETAYMTDRGMEFIDEMGDKPWLLHLSFIKPHWPYIAPAPYHALYGSNSFLPPHRSQRERENAHPVFAAFQQHQVSRTFSDNKMRETVLTGYMGLVKQIDDHMGRLFKFLEERGLFKNTMVIFTSDHGDYLGDHWLGEKELFHEEAARIPLIIYDPDPSADKTRGTVENRFVEAIDLVPTFLDVYDAPVSRHRLEGRSIISLLRGPAPREWRDSVFSEIDYGFYQAREILDVGPSDARGYMIRTDRWKYVHFKGHKRPQLFHLHDDPDEFEDLGGDAGYAAICAELHERLFDRLLDRRNRLTYTDEQVLARRQNEGANGIIIGRW